MVVASQLVGRIAIEGDDAARKALESIYDATESVRAKLTDSLSEAADQASASLLNFGNELVDSTDNTKTATSLLDRASESVRQFSSRLSEDAVGAADVFSARVAATLQPLTRFRQVIGSGFANATELIVSRLKIASSTVTSFALTTVSSINTFSSKLLSAINPVIQFSQRITQSMSNVAAAMASRLVQVASAVGTFVARIGSVFSQAGLVILGFGIKAAQGIGHAVSAIQAKFSQAAQDIGTFRDQVQSRIGEVVSAVKSRFAQIAAPVIEFGNRVRQAAQPVINFGQKVASALAPLRSFASGALNASGALVRMTGSALRAINPISALASRAKQGSFNLLDFGAKAGATIFGIQSLAQGAINLASSLFAPNAQFEQMTVSFEAFIPNAKQLTSTLAGLKKFSATTPFESEEVNQSALSLLNMDVAAQDLTKWLGNVGAAVSKVGGSGQTFKDVNAIIAQMGVKGKITTEEMQQLTERNIPAFKLLANTMGIPVSTLQDMISNGELGREKIDLLVESMGQFGGDAMIKQSKTFNGLWSTITDNIGEAFKSFTGGAFEKAKEGLAKLGEIVSSPAFQQFAVDMGTKVGDAISKVADFVQNQAMPAFNNIWNIISKNVVPAFQNAAKWLDTFTGNGQGLTPILAGLGAILLTLVVPAMAALAVNVAIATWPFLLIGAAVAGLTAIFLHFYNSNAGFKAFIDNIGKVLQDLWNTISSNFMPTMQNLGNILQNNVGPALQNIGNFLVTTFKPAWDQLVTTFQTQLVPAWNQFMAALQPAMPFFQLIGAIILGVLIFALGLLVGYIVGMVTAIGGALPGIIQAFGGIVQFISGIVQVILSIVSFFVHLFTGQFDKLGGDLGKIWDGIVMMFQGAWNFIAGIFKAAWGLISGYVSGFISSIIKFFTDMWNKLVGHSIIPDMINGIINWFFRLPGRVGEAVASMVSKVMGKLNNLASDALNAGSNIVNNIAQGIRNAIGNVANAIGSVAQYIKDHLPHSPAKIGPLRYLEEQGTEITSQIATGMLSGLPQLRAALGDVVGPISSTMTPGATTTSVQAIPTSFSTAPSVRNSSSGQPIVLVMDGRIVARGMMPHIVSEVRNSVGVRF